MTPASASIVRTLFARSTVQENADLWAFSVAIPV